ncbi:MAG: uracil-DNA glycosylase [Neisseriaceae bacterium]|nr:uracil-DNA glycosylase [Neisseriaceae bacterium]MBP6862917.1 uracil-DNA glycosylase [Neisseriaceae bacterium]
MLDTRYVHLHQALGLGPLWVNQAATLVPNADAGDTPAAAPTQRAQAAVNPQQRPHASSHPSPVPTAPATPPAAPRHTPAASGHVAASRASLFKTLDIKPQPSEAETAAAAAAALAAEQAKTPTVEPIILTDGLDLQSIHKHISVCTACPLHQSRKQALPGRGQANSPIMVVSPAPSQDDDLHNQLLHGTVGALLNNMLASIDLSVDQVFLSSSIKCSPSLTVPVQPEYQKNCLTYLNAQIQANQPKALLFLGENLTKHCAITPQGLTYQDLPTFIVPHPAKLLRHTADKRRAWHTLSELKRWLKQA